jgi:hypothetical protein
MILIMAFHVILSPFAALWVNSAKHLSAQRDRPFAAAQGDNYEVSSVDAYRGRYIGGGRDNGDGGARIEGGV